MLTRDERAEAGRLVVGMPRPERFCFRLESTDEPVEQRALDADALGSEAHLTTVEEHRTQDAFDRGVAVCNGEDDGAVLSAPFKRKLAKNFTPAHPEGRSGP